MGLIDRLFGLLFGAKGNVIQQTAEVFVENAEKGAARTVALQADALAQYATEFQARQRGLFDRLLDGVNRLPRPAMALGTLGLFTAAMLDPIWFAKRMQGIALVPEPLWWLLGAVVSFYFGARHQVKNQQFQRQVAQSIAMTPSVMRNLHALDALKPKSDGQTDVPSSTATVSSPAVHTQNFPENAALQDWLVSNR